MTVFAYPPVAAGASILTAFVDLPTQVVRPPNPPAGTIRLFIAPTGGFSGIDSTGAPVDLGSLSFAGFGSAYLRGQLKTNQNP